MHEHMNAKGTALTSPSVNVQLVYLFHKLQGPKGSRRAIGQSMKFLHLNGNSQNPIRWTSASPPYHYEAGLKPSLVS